MEKIPAPIDNKNIMEDAIDDEVFRGFYLGNEGGFRRRHMIGTVDTESYSAIVEAKWKFGENSIDIKLVGTKPGDEPDDVRREVFELYEHMFKAWQCEDNPSLIVETSQALGTLTIWFYFEA